MILSTYVAGLDDDSNTFGAFGNQFSEGRPSYAAGLLFEVPLGNRASRARLARNRWELARTLHEFQQTTEVTFTAVEVAVRETRTAFDELLAKKQAIDAANREVDYLQQRWELLPDPNESAILLIENLLDAQERLADEERAFTQSQVDYAMSWVRLRKAMGVLLRLEDTNYGPLISTQPTEPTDPTRENIATPIADSEALQR
jgi:outer membrane protein TolC